MNYIATMLMLMTEAKQQGFRIKRWRMTESQALDAAIQAKNWDGGTGRTIAERYAEIKEGRVPIFDYPVEVRP
jgi:hypothetical protein